MALAFWNNINRLIRQADTTQEVVAQKAGISVNTLRGWASKDIYPRVDDAYKVAKALGTTVEYLFTGEENPGIPKEVLLTAW